MYAAIKSLMSNIHLFKKHFIACPYPDVVHRFYMLPYQSLEDWLPLEYYLHHRKGLLN